MNRYGVVSPILYGCSVAVGVTVYLLYGFVAGLLTLLYGTLLMVWGFLYVIRRHPWRLHRHHKPVPHELAVERAHSAKLADKLVQEHEALAQAHETIRKQARAIDDLKYERRELAGQVANLRAQLATAEALRVRQP